MQHKDTAESAGDAAIMYERSMDAFLNRWFATYEDARAAREHEGGFLLPYRNHFFVTHADAICGLGLDPDDPDWARIGWDWVAPADLDAWQRLREKRQLARRGAP